MCLHVSCLYQLAPQAQAASAGRKRRPSPSTAQRRAIFVCGSLTQRLHPLPLGLQLTYPTGVHTLSHLRAYAGPPTPAAVRRGEAGSTRWAALAHYVRRSAAVCEPQLSAERMQEKKKNPKNSKTKAGAAGAWVGAWPWVGGGSLRAARQAHACSGGPRRQNLGAYQGSHAAHQGHVRRASRGASGEAREGRDLIVVARDEG